MKRRRKDTDPGGLDSLLDTMTNVVGILIVLVAVTQMSVATSMGRIQRSASETLTAISDPGAETADPDNRFGDEEADLQAELARLEAWRTAVEQELVAPTAASGRSAAQARAIERRIKGARSKLRDLRVHLAGLDLAAFSATSVRLPDPRPPPPDSNPVRYLARYGRVAQLPERELTSLVSNESKHLTGRDVLRDGEPFATSKLIERFSDNELGTRNFTIKLRRIRQWIAFEVLWRSQSAGENLSELAQLESVYAQELAELDPARHHLEFKVWPDGIDAYLLARRLAERKGFSAGWTAFDKDEAYKGRLSHRNIDPTPID